MSETDRIFRLRVAEADGWGEPEPLQLSVPELPPFPTNALPHWLADFVEEEARATQTPSDLAGALSLAAIATTVQGKAVVAPKRADPGYQEPLNLYAAVALPPASRKSAVFADVMAPITAFEAERREQSREVVARAEAQIQLLHDALDAKRKAVRNASAGDPEGLAREVGDLAVELQREEERCPKEPRILVSDVTPQALARLLAEHGTLTLASAEGSEVFAIAAGRYATDAQPNFDVLKKAHAGDSIMVDRVRGEPLRCEDPALTLALTIQPSVLEEIRSVSSFRGEGLLGRFWFAVPVPTVGTRSWDQAGVRAAVRQTFDRMMRQLLELPREPKPRVMVLDDHAEQALRAFHDELEPLLAAEAELGWMADWAGKLVGLTARWSGILHCVEWIDVGATLFSTPIDQTTMERAIVIARYALSHAEAALSQGPESSLLSDCRRVWEKIDAKHGDASTVTTREVMRWLGGSGAGRRFECNGDLVPVLSELSDRGFLRRSEDRKAWELSPRALGVSGVSTVSGLQRE